MVRIAGGLRKAVAAASQRGGLIMAPMEKKTEKIRLTQLTQTAG